METLIILYGMICVSYVFIVGGGVQMLQSLHLCNIDKVVMIVLFPATLVIIILGICWVFLEGLYSAFKGKSWFEEWK